jgi:hypothetical protein
MDECYGLLDKSVFKYLMKVMPDDIKEELINCDSKTGGRKSRKGKMRKLRGGLDPNFRKRVIMGIYLFLGICISYIATNADTTTLRRGFEMLYSGQCNNISELALDYFGIGNPICTTHHRMIVVVGCALKGQTEAVMQIVGLVASGIAAPLMIHSAINNLASMIETRVAALLGITSGTIEDVNIPAITQGQPISSMTNVTERTENTAADVARQIIEQIRSTPGLNQAIRDIINQQLHPEMQMDEERIEEIHAASQPNTQEEEYGGSRKSRKTRKNRKSKKHNKKHKKQTKKHRKRKVNTYEPIDVVK